MTKQHIPQYDDFRYLKERLKQCVEEKKIALQTVSKLKVFPLIYGLKSIKFSYELISLSTTNNFYTNLLTWQKFYYNLNTFLYSIISILL